MALRLSSTVRKVDRILKNGLFIGNLYIFAQAQPKSLEARRFFCQSSFYLSNKPKGFIGLKGNDKGATNIRSAGPSGMSTDKKVSEAGEKAGEGVVTSRTPGYPDLLPQPPFPLRLAMLLRMPPAPKDLQLKYAWNPEDRSSNISVKSLVGINDQSWGWDLVRNKMCHDGGDMKFPGSLKPDQKFQVPDTFLVALDMDEGILGFVVEGQTFAVAFGGGLKSKKVFPIVSAVSDHCEITMKYVGGLGPEQLPVNWDLLLMDILTDKFGSSTTSKEGHNGSSTPQQDSNQDPGSASDGWSIGDIFGD